MNRRPFFQYFLSSVLLTSILSIAPAFAVAESGDGHGDKAAVDHDGDHGDAGHHGTLEINWFDFSRKPAPVLALLINFALLVFILYILLRKSLTKRFKDRKETLEVALKEAEEVKAAAEKALGQARAKMESIDREMGKIREDVVAAGQAESARIVEDAKTRAERMRSDAKVMVEQEIARMAQGIREQVTEEIVAMAEQLVREKIARADHDRLAKDYLDGMRLTSPSPTADR